MKLGQEDIFTDHMIAENSGKPKENKLLNYISKFSKVTHGLHYKQHNSEKEGKNQSS